MFITGVGTAPLSFQWRFDGLDIPGGTSANFVIPTVQLNQAGMYSVVMSNSWGTALSGDTQMDVKQIAIWRNGTAKTNLPPDLTNVVAVSAGGCTPFFYEMMAQCPY